MQDVSDKLLSQFVACIEGQFGAATPGCGPRPEAAAATETVAPAADVTAAEATVPSPAAEVPTPAPEVPPRPRPRPAAPSPAAATPAPTRASRAQPPTQDQDDALDLGSTVLPILLRTYGKQVAVGVVVVVAVIVLWRVLSG